MCYSPAVSLALSAFGAYSTWFAWRSRGLRRNWAHVYCAFYTLMELTQTVQYFYVNECLRWENRALTEFAYLLVVAQPLMFHAIFYVRNPGHRELFGASLAMFAVWLAFSAASRIAGPSEPVALPDAEAARLSERRWSYLLQDVTCTLRDAPGRHLYWQWAARDLLDFNANYLGYLTIWFVPPLFVPRERLTMASIFACFAAGLALTSAFGKMEEHPSTWCFVSVPAFAFMYVRQIKRALAAAFGAVAVRRARAQ